jgi:hypothetical protein
MVYKCRQRGWKIICSSIYGASPEQVRYGKWGQVLDKRCERQGTLVGNGSNKVLVTYGQVGVTFAFDYARHVRGHVGRGVARHTHNSGNGNSSRGGYSIVVINSVHNSCKRLSETFLDEIDKRLCQCLIVRSVREVIRAGSGAVLNEDATHFRQPSLS